MRHRILLGAAFLYLAVSNIIWIARDTRPPFWDMAYHLSGAIHVYNAFASSGIAALAAIPRQLLTGYYPPLYHSVIAAAWAVFGKSVAVARLSNLAAIAILLFATYGIGRFLLEPFPAAVAATVVSFYPELLWLSRETIIDYWLTAIVALAIWTLLKTDGFSNLRWSVSFGVVAGLGMLTKQTFPFFVILPALWLARRNWTNALLAAVISLGITAYWYLPAVPALMNFLKLNTAGGIFEGDPDRLSIGAIVFYLRALEGSQLFLPLFAAFIAGLAFLWKKFDDRWIPVLLWLVGGWLGLLLFQNKDPRYSAPLLPAIALITALAFREQRRTIALIVFLLFQHYVVSFGIRRLPASVILMKGPQTQVSSDWNLYEQSYAGLWGRPVREDWKIDHVLQRVKTGRLGLVPDIPRFDSQAFQFGIELVNAPIQLNRIGTFNEAAIRANDYVLMAESDREHEASAAPDSGINGYITAHPEIFQISEWFSLPNGAVIRLYKVE